MQVDYIIVGFGLAGLAVAETLERQKKSFIVFDTGKEQSSFVAASVYNPVVLKRFTAVWDGLDQLNEAQLFYKQLEARFKKKYDDALDIFRIFSSIEEQNNWYAASDKPVLSSFLVPEILKNTNAGITAPFGYGQVRSTGKLRTKELLSDYRNYLDKQGRLFKTGFIYDELELLEQGLNYQGVAAKQLIFCEGFGLKKNPYFKALPIVGAKGELLTIAAPKLQLTNILKASVFVLPLGDDLYKVGATFNHTDKTSLPTAIAKQELIRKLDAIIKVPYTIVKHEAGVRPTVKDRRPILGKHQQYKQLALLNGLGTRGVLLAPKMAKILINHLEQQQDIPKEISIDRFL